MAHHPISLLLILRHLKVFAHLVAIRIHLLVRANRVIHVIAGITAKGDYMITKTIEESDVTQTTRAEKARADKKPPVARKRAHAAPAKANAAKKANRKKNALGGGKKADGARDGSKASQVVELLKRPGGATAKELMKVTGWQPHSVRGFLSGTLRKKLGLTVASIKGDGERTYSIKT
jgi:hypothetical protein